MSTMAYRYTENDSWHDLDIETKVSLITVIERVRFGAAVSPKGISGSSVEHDLLRICAEHDLAASTMPVMTTYDIIISHTPKALQDLRHHAIGFEDFLGYPRCCVDNFEEEIRHALQRGTPRNAAKYWENAREALAKGTFPGVLLYALHVPCGIDCAPSKRMAARVQDVLERVDPYVARRHAAVRHECIMEKGY